MKRLDNIAGNAAMLALMLGAAIGLMATPVQAQTLCGPHEGIVEALTGQQLKQTQMLGGLSNNGYLFELFVGPEGKWTVLGVYSNGRACILDLGEGLDLHRPKPAGQRS